MVDLLLVPGDVWLATWPNFVIGLTGLGYCLGWAVDMITRRML